MKDEIIKYLQNNPKNSSSEIFNGIETSKSFATLKRILQKLLSENLIISEGKGKSTKYSISPFYKVFQKVDTKEYFKEEIDERIINKHFNISLISDILSKVNLFTKQENDKLSELQKIYSQNINELSQLEYRKELERLAIDLSWKSSQIEGNTYSLLETERLLKEKKTASGKTKEEAIMLLNHKEALDFIIETPDYFFPLTVGKIEDIHSILIKELGVDKNVRKRRVGISGTNYSPLDNEFQIKESLSAMCKLVNRKENVFEKALLTLVLIAYIQPFVDGNKRTSRIVSNAVMINYKHCPISFRTVESVEYKKAMLLFYEQNNITVIKEIFLNQFEFAVTTYF
ncbi:MAG TPA: cell filamentation protein Fic [Ignavibacteria bacterium]|nr:cell filamentation protein Fic [Ignavibacteria bacterium]